MIPMACGNVSILAEMSPIVMTITAELLFRIAVTTMLTIRPFRGASVIVVIHFFRESPEKLYSPLTNKNIPK
jgi:hypothetical protein